MDIEIFLFFFVPFLFTYALMIGLGFLEIQILKHTFKVKDFILVILLKSFEIFFIFPLYTYYFIYFLLNQYLSGMEVSFMARK